MTQAKPRPDFTALAESLDHKHMEFCGDTPKLQQAVEAMRWAAQEQDKERGQPVAWIDMAYWPPIRWPDGLRRCDVKHLDGAALYAAPQPNAALADGWMDPSDAPKDGTEFLAVYGRQGNVQQLARWNYLYGQWESKGNWLPGFEANVTAIHMLPAPPTLNASKEPERSSHWESPESGPACSSCFSSDCNGECMENL